MNNRIKYFVTDVDGTLTDGTIYMGQDGEIMKSFSVKDGYAIHNILSVKGITPVVITGRRSKIVENRCKEIGIAHLVQGSDNKVESLVSIVQANNFFNVAYIGDDLNDLEIIMKVNEDGGLTACPSDAVEIVRKTVAYVCAASGGKGAVREFIEWICNNEKMRITT